MCIRDRAKEVQKAEHAIENGECPLDALPELKPVMEAVNKEYPLSLIHI